MSTDFNIFLYLTYESLITEVSLEQANEALHLYEHPRLLQLKLFLWRTSQFTVIKTVAPNTWLWDSQVCLEGDQIFMKHSHFLNMNSQYQKIIYVTNLETVRMYILLFSHDQESISNTSKLNYKEKCWKQQSEY